MIAATFVEALLQNLRGFIPAETVHSFQQGVYFKKGVDTKELGPGWHWHVPIRDHIEVINVQEQGLDLPLQTVTTQDGFEVTISMNVFFVIKSARKMYVGVDNFDHWINRRCAGHIARKARTRTYDELKFHQRSLERSILRTLNTRVERYGVEIMSVEITDFCKSKSYRLLQGM